MTGEDRRIALARASFAAYVAKDRVRIEALLSPDFHFSSPLDNRLDRAAYFARCWPNAEKIDGFDFIRFAAVDDTVFVTYEGRAGDRRFRNTEVFTIQGDQIAAVEVYFGWSLPHPAAPGGFVEN
jgi:hypothetical protein